MSLDSNTHPLDELAVYALDALEADERLAVEQHLAGCPSCRAELDRHLETLAELSTPEAPPAHVWDRIAEEISGIGRQAVDRGESHDPPADVLRFAPPDPETPRHRAPRRRSGGSRTVWLAGLAAAAAVAAIVGVGAMAMRGEANDTVQDLALAAADDPHSQVVTLAADDGTAQARVVLAEDGTSYVLLDDLPQLPAGRAYQLWKLGDTGAPVSLGVLGDGSTDAAAVAVPGDATNFAITDEPAGGVPAPTGPTAASTQA